MAERSVPLTAEQIYNLCKDWPANAWPDGVRWRDAMLYLHRGFFVDSDGYHIRCHLAAALFRDSGLMWLVKRYGFAAQTDSPKAPDQNSRFSVNLSIGVFYGPSLLVAISAAISAIKKEQENG